jgi:hypothetical protein
MNATADPVDPIERAQEALDRLDDEYPGKDVMLELVEYARHLRTRYSDLLSELYSGLLLEADVIALAQDQLCVLSELARRKYSHLEPRR